MKQSFCTLLIPAAVIWLMFSACQIRTLSDSTEPETVTHYTVIFVIHADAGYLYHENGQPHYSDLKVLEQARRFAEEAAHGEVFIFHQRPERRIAGIFHRDNRLFYHYHSGDLLHRQRYSANADGTPFDVESELYSQYRRLHHSQEKPSYLLYFGHEIPMDAEQDQNYHRSSPGIIVNQSTFASGLQGFLPGNGKLLDLMVLSTCSNGTPDMVRSLLPVTQLLLASPEELHLSHMDADALIRLETEPGLSARKLAEIMAEETYNRLSASIHTTITLALYDMQAVRSYIDLLEISYRNHLQLQPTVTARRNSDCSNLSLTDAVTISTGVQSWFRPARFGQGAGRISHSGWGCRPR